MSEELFSSDDDLLNLGLGFDTIVHQVNFIFSPLLYESCLCLTVMRTGAIKENNQVHLNRQTWTYNALKI